MLAGPLAVEEAGANRSQGARAIVERWRKEMGQRTFDGVGEKDDAASHISMSERDKEEEEALQQVMKSLKKEE